MKINNQVKQAIAQMVTIVITASLTIGGIIVYDEHYAENDTNVSPDISSADVMPQSLVNQSDVVDNDVIFSGLELDSCDIKRYNVSDVEQRSVQQCYPKNYEIYDLDANGEGHKDEYTLPIEVEYMGVEFHANLHNRSNGVCFTREAISLERGTYLLKVYGSVNVLSDERRTFGIAVFHSIPGFPEAEPKRQGFPVNGQYKAEWEIVLGQNADIEPTVCVFSNFGDLPPWSKITIENIELVRVDW